MLKVGENVEVIGYKVKPEKSQVNGIGYYKLNKKQFNKAEALLKLNIPNYLETGNYYDVLGDLYLVKGNKAKAIERFKKALSLKAIPETKQKLEILLIEKK